MDAIYLHEYSLPLSLINSIVMSFNLLGFLRSLLVVVPPTSLFTGAIDLDTDVAQAEFPKEEGLTLPEL